MTLTASTVIPLNEPEHLFVALEGLAGTMTSNYIVQLNTSVPEAQVRAAARELVSAHPRFRGIVERGAWRPHLRILPDDTITDQLFEQAWRVESHIDAQDPQAIERYHNRLVNESIQLERGLACGFRWIPHPESPILIMVVHHLICDGRSGMYALSALIRRLNEDRPIPPEPLEPVPVLTATRPAHWWQWPAAILAEVRIRAQEKRRHRGTNLQMVNKADRRILSTYAVRHHTLSTPTDQIRALSRQLGVSLTTLVILGLTDAFLSYAPGDPRAAAVIRLAIDLRPFHDKAKGYGPLLGNQVGTFLVSQVGMQPLAQRVTSVGDQMRDGAERYAQRKMGLGIWVAKVASYLGPNLMAYFTLRLQRRLAMPRISCYVTSVGDVGKAFNRPGQAIKVTSFVGSIPSLSMLHILMELDGWLTMPLIWQRCEASDEVIDDYLRRVDQAMAAMMLECAAMPTAGG